MISSMDAEYGGGVWKLGMAMEHDDRDIVIDSAKNVWQ